MSSDPTKISIDQSSVCRVLFDLNGYKKLNKIYKISKIINLKAELQRKQEEFRLKRASKSYDRLENEYETHKVFI